MVLEVLIPGIFILATMDTCIGYASIGGICTLGYCAKSILIRNNEPKILVGLGIILAGLRVNN